jgi:hypothetical protein
MVIPDLAKMFFQFIPACGMNGVDFMQHTISCCYIDNFLETKVYTLGRLIPYIQKFFSGFQALGMGICRRTITVVLL